MDRRSFFKRSALILPALVVGDAALEAMERLTHRKVFLGADFARGSDRSVVRTGLPEVQWRHLNGDAVTAREIEASWTEAEDRMVTALDRVQQEAIVKLFSRMNPILMELPWKSASS